MNQAQAKADKPLDRLASMLDDDMKAVNALIIDSMQSPIDLIPQLAGYLIAAGGKRVRPLLTLAAAASCGTCDARAHNLAAAVEFIHTATLLHDDVVDESGTRRGQAAANVVFGNQASVLVGDFLFSRAFQMMVAAGDMKVLDILSGAAAVIAEGEVLQMSHIGNMELRVDDYNQIIAAKTAALFSASTEAGARIAGADAHTVESYRLYGHHLGMAFQIIDDVLDYGASQPMGKNSGDDFAEGKLTLPVILAIAAATTPEERSFWQRTLGDKDQQPDDLEQARSYLAAHDALAKARNAAATHVENARRALRHAPQTKITALLDDLLDFIIARDH